MRHVRYICIAALAMLCLCGALAAGMSACWAPRVRTPEIDPAALFRRQAGALSAGRWSGEWRLWTNPDWTWARWAAVSDLGTDTSPTAVAEELHVFSRPLRAMVIAPSVRSVTADWPKRKPPGWRYRPAYADRFVIGFGTYEGRQDTCLVLLRYQEYVIVISAEFTETFGSGDLQALLAETDAFMAEFLQGSRLSRGERPVPEAGLPVQEPSG